MTQVFIVFFDYINIIKYTNFAKPTSYINSYTYSRIFLSFAIMLIVGVKLESF